MDINFAIVGVRCKIRNLKMIEEFVEKKCFSGVQELHPSAIFQLKESIQSCNMAGRYNDGGYGGGGGGYGGR